MDRLSSGHGPLLPDYARCGLDSGRMALHIRGEDDMAGRAVPAEGKRRGVFTLNEEAAPAELELTWSYGGYHGFGADGGTWSAISSAGDVLTGDTPDALNRAIGAHWKAMQ